MYTQLLSLSILLAADVLATEFYIQSSFRVDTTDGQTTEVEDCNAARHDLIQQDIQDAIQIAADARDVLLDPNRYDHITAFCQEIFKPYNKDLPSTEDV